MKGTLLLTLPYGASLPSPRGCKYTGKSRIQETKLRQHDDTT